MRKMGVLESRASFVFQCDCNGARGTKILHNDMLTLYDTFLPVG